MAMGGSIVRMPVVMLAVVVSQAAMGVRTEVSVLVLDIGMTMALATKRLEDNRSGHPPQATHAAVWRDAHATGSIFQGLRCASCLAAVALLVRERRRS
jgi:hypothetical protein